ENVGRSLFKLRYEQKQADSSTPLSLRKSEVDLVQPKKDKTGRKTTEPIAFAQRPVTSPNVINIKIDEASSRHARRTKESTKDKFQRLTSYAGPQLVSVPRSVPAPPSVSPTQLDHGKPQFGPESIPPQKINTIGPDIVARPPRDRKDRSQIVKYKLTCSHGHRKRYGPRMSVSPTKGCSTKQEEQSAPSIPASQPAATFMQVQRIRNREARTVNSTREDEEEYRPKISAWEARGESTSPMRRIGYAKNIAKCSRQSAAYHSARES
uniref:Uncharacterized protein n=1 Tax=Ciona savignyi TaxID=51511 RepID=H2YWD6_CIOSA